jgi:Protein of unknown function (DUF2946)
MRKMAAGSRRANVPQWLTSLVLAVLCLRALVPVGFMLASVDGRLAIVLCDSDATTQLHDAAVHHHGGHDHANHHHANLDPTCPYAQSSGPAPLPALPVLAAAPISAEYIQPADPARNYSHFGPSRQQSPRGPPSLA